MNRLSARQHHARWKIQAPLGLVLFGAGICLVTDAAQLKSSGAPLGDWVLYGTLALIVTNAGLSVFADAAKHRALFEWKREQESPD